MKGAYGDITKKGTKPSLMSKAYGQPLGQARSGRPGRNVARGPRGKAKPSLLK